MHQRRRLRSIPLITLLLIATACSASPAPITTPPPAPADAAQLAPSVPVVTATSRVPTEQATTSPLAPSIAPATPALTATLAPSGPATIPYRLPLDQPWFLLSDDHLIAISRAGGWTLFGRRMRILDTNNERGRAAAESVRGNREGNSNGLAVIV